MSHAATFGRPTTAVHKPHAGALRLDGPLLLLIALLALGGLVILASASIPLAAEQGDPFRFLLRQAVFLVLGCIAGYFMLATPSDFWYRHQGTALMLSFLLLILVLIPGVGREVNGSVRWISLGPINVQVSELARLLVLIYLAGYLHRYRAQLRGSLWVLIRPLLLLALLSLMLLMQPDFGATVVMLSIAMGLFFIAGVPMRLFVILSVLLGAAFLVLVITSPYRLLRLLSFLDPWQDPFGSGFQLTQSLIAIGRGEIDGVGLGQGVQKLFYLPEAHTDFIFAVMAEETGLIGVLSLITLYALLIWRMMRVSLRAERQGDYFGAHLVAGVGLWIAVQVLINLGVNMGVLPTKGLTLPMISYGGSSLATLCIAFGMVLRIDAESRAEEDQAGSAVQETQ